MASPRIASISWGHIAPSSLPEGKDYKLYPGGGRVWDWNETGMRHSPGIQQADVEELVKAGATDVVLSRGMEEKLGVPDATVRWLEDQGIKVHVAETKKAVEMYNRLVDQGRKGLHRREDEETILENYLPLPGSAELASIRKAMQRRVGGQTRCIEVAMSDIRYAGQFNLAEALGDTIITELDAARVIAGLLRVARERQSEPGFGAQVVKRLANEFEDDDAAFEDG